MSDVFESIRRQFTELPPKGKPAAELTARDKLALAFGAGVPCEFVIEGTTMTLKSKVPFAVTDRGDGGYIIAQAQK